MFERILVPLDGSPLAERAIPVAARIARSFGSSIIVLSVVAPPVSTAKFHSPEAYPPASLGEELAEATAYLDALVQSDQLKGIATEAQALTGAAAPAILSATQSLHASLIVLCSHGYTGFRHWRVGSVAEKVIRHAPSPVFVLREGGPETAATGQQGMRMLVALDGSPLSEAILEPTAWLTAGLAQTASQQGMLQLLQIVDVPSRYGKFRSPVDSFVEAEIRKEVKQQDEQYLEAVAKRFAEGEWANDHLAITTAVVTDPDVADALVRTAEQGKFDCIALATHGRGGVQHWALGSITERVLHTTKLPLFIVRSQIA